MIVEERTYSIKPGTFAEFMERYWEEGYPIQLRHFGQAVGHFHRHTGKLCQLIHLWPHRDLDQRDARRLSLATDEEWQAFARKVSPFVERAQNRILETTPLPTDQEVEA